MRYTYRIRFTNSSLFPWRWAVYLDGKLLTDNPLDWTGSAETAWGARYAARRFIRRHRKHHGQEYQG